MSGPPDRSSAQKRRSFLVFVLALAVVAAVVAFTLSRGDDGTSGASTPSSDASTSATLQTVCGEVPPDMAFRVDALRRTANRVRDDIAAMRALGNDSDAAKAVTVAEALERLADAQDSQRGVGRATRELGQTLASIC